MKQIRTGTGCGKTIINADTVMVKITCPQNRNIKIEMNDNSMWIISPGETMDFPLADIWEIEFIAQ